MAPSTWLAGRGFAGTKRIGGLALCLVLAACNSINTSPSPAVGSAPPASTGSAAPAPVESIAPAGNLPVPGSEVVIAIPALGTGDFSPSGSGDDNEKAISLMGEALVGVDPTSRQLVGELAESYELSDDGKTWTFKLRPDIPFHGGMGTVTSEDVKHSWEGYIAPESTHGGAAQMAQAVDGDINNFEIISDLEFALHTENPVVFLPATLSKPAAVTKVLENLELAKGRPGSPPKITISTVIEEWNITEVERLLDWCGEQGFVFAAQSAQMEKMPNLALLKSAKYQALVDKIIERRREGKQAINGTPKTIETLLRFRDFQCYPTMFPRVYPNGDVFYPCEPLRKIAGNLLRDGSLVKIFAAGKKKYGDIPPCQGICYLFGNVLSHYYVNDFWGLAGDFIR